MIEFDLSFKLGRLVYADYLEDNNEIEKANLIRQVEKDKSILGEHNKQTILNQQLTKNQYIELVNDFAENNFHAYEDCFPKDKRVRDSIEAVKQYLKTGEPVPQNIYNNVWNAYYESHNKLIAATAAWSAARAASVASVSGPSGPADWTVAAAAGWASVWVAEAADRFSQWQWILYRAFEIKHFNSQRIWT